jgi:hypothetical protein
MVNIEIEVWRATADNGRFVARVVRDTEGRSDPDSWYHGILTAHDTRDGRELLRRPVVLAYGARFGPDMEDVEQWMAWVEAVLPSVAGA